MERDRRLTGFMRGQTDKAEAPAGFELNNPWRVSMTFRADFGGTDKPAVRAAIHIKQCATRSIESQCYISKSAMTIPFVNTTLRLDL